MPKKQGYVSPSRRAANSGRSGYDRVLRDLSAGRSVSFGSGRGTKRGRRDDTRRSETTSVMRKFRSETKRIVQGPGSWAAKHKAIKDQYDYVNYLMRG